MATNVTGAPMNDELTTAQLEVLHTVVAVAATASMVGSLGIMYAQHRLGAVGVSMRILYWLSFADVISDIVALMGIGIRHPSKFCKMQAFLVTFADLAPILWTGCMSAALFFSIFVDHRRAKRGEAGFGYYTLLAFGLPLLVAVVGLATDSYGDSGFGACWIESADGRLYYFYFPLWLTFIFNSLVYGVVWWEYRQAMLDRHGSLGTTRSTSRAHRLKYYPAVLILTWGMGTVNRIVETSSGGSDYTLTVVAMALGRSQGVFNLLVYGTDPVQRLYPWFKQQATCIYGKRDADDADAEAGGASQDAEMTAVAKGAEGGAVAAPAGMWEVSYNLDDYAEERGAGDAVAAPLPRCHAPVVAHAHAHEALPVEPQEMRKGAVAG